MGAVMKLRLTAWIENGDIFFDAWEPNEESFIRISYDRSEGRPMKWGATMADAEPEEPEEVEISKIELRLGRGTWANVTDHITDDTFEKLANKILEGGLS